jgi:hypothetical protein
MTSERRVKAARGNINGYHWAEHWSVDLSAADVIAALRDHLTGLRAVCSSWDSAILDTRGPAFSQWETQSGQAVSPVISKALAQSWPRSSCAWDEWYFFQAVPQFEKIRPFCNWAGISLAGAAELENVPTGFSLAIQLGRYRPQLVVGDGDRVFLVTEDENMVMGFIDLCSAAEQRDAADEVRDGHSSRGPRS